MTRTLFLICFAYYLFVAPKSIWNIWFYEISIPDVQLGLFCLYWLQYSVNFVIYAARCEQYRKAYMYTLKAVNNHFRFGKVMDNKAKSLFTGLEKHLQMSKASEKNGG